jgi:hypothetical protein
MKEGFYLLTVTEEFSNSQEFLNRKERMRRENALKVYTSKVVEFAAAGRIGTVELFENGARLRTAKFSNDE